MNNFKNFIRDNYDESLSTLKFADRAKSVFSKIKPNEILAADQDLIKKLTDEINNLKQILSIRKKRGNFGEVENQFIRLKEENEKLKQNFLSSEEIEKLMYENRVLKLELQKLKSKNDFYVDAKSFEGNINANSTALLSNILDNPTPSVKSINDNLKSNKYQNLENRYGETLNALNENPNDLNADKSNEIKQNNDFINIQGNNENMIYLSSSNKNYKNFRNANNNYEDKLRNHPEKEINENKYGNENLPNSNTNSSNNINDIINNLMLNNNADSISELSMKKKTFSYKDTIGENSLSNKKSSAYNSLFKAGESLISGQFSAINKSINQDKKNRPPDIVALKQVNERLKYLENLEKESSKLLNKQREKIKIEKIKKEEEMKKKIEDV